MASLKFKGLKKASSETKGLTGYYSGHYVQLSYDIETGEVITDYHYSLGHNSWTVYHDENIVIIGNIVKPKTMKEIAEMIEKNIAQNLYYKKETKDWG